MPIYSVKMTENLARLCGATLTPNVKSGLTALPSEDKEAAAIFGVEFAYQQCRQLLQKGVDGIHFYTMDRASTVEAVIHRLKDDRLL